MKEKIKYPGTKKIIINLSYLVLFFCLTAFFIFLPEKKHYSLGIEIPPWWNDNWQYRRKLTFDNSGQTESLTNFPVLVKLTSSNFDFSKVKWRRY